MNSETNVRPVAAVVWISALVGSCALWPISGASETISAERRPPTADPATTFRRLHFALVNKRLDLSRYRGKVLYVNFFASWCPPCNREAPKLAALARKYAPLGLAVIGIDEAEDGAHALGFRERDALPYPIVLDPEGIGEAPFGAPSLPMHVFFDRNGIVAAMQNGTLDETIAASTIELLLGENKQ